MNNKNINPIVFFAVGICAAVLPLLFMHLFNRVGTKLQEAEELYSKGESSQTLAERTDSFNQALAVYLKLEKDYQPINGNGKLYYDIGNTYYQLSEYPLALYYYYQASALMPKDEKILQNISSAQRQLGLPPAPRQSSIFPNVFFFNDDFSLPRRYQIFAVSTAIAILLSSIWIWKKWKYLKYLIALSLIISIVFFLSICYSEYLAPAEGIVVRASGLYRDAGNQYAKVQKEPIPSGTKVEVLAVQKNGAWVKILTSDGTLGYLQQENIRILQN